MSSGPVGPGGCQISAVSSARHACRRVAVMRRWTGKVWLSLCRKDDNPMFGPGSPISKSERKSNG